MPINLSQILKVANRASTADIKEAVERHNKKLASCQSHIDESWSADISSKEHMFQALRAYPNIARINVRYEGYGDSGCVDTVSFYDDQGLDITASVGQDIYELVEDYVCDKLSGLEIDDGGNADVCIDVARQAATFDVEEYHTESSSRSFED